jgi:hypothetical protein
VTTTFSERDQDLAAARAANRERTTRLNTQARLREPDGIAKAEPPVPGGAQLGWAAPRRPRSLAGQRLGGMQFAAWQDAVPGTEPPQVSSSG